MRDVKELHAAIMNLPCQPRGEPQVIDLLSYKFGHRDARHAAAELALQFSKTPADAAAALEVIETHRLTVVLCENGWVAYRKQIQKPEPNGLAATPLAAVRDWCQRNGVEWPWKGGE